MDQIRMVFVLLVLIFSVCVMLVVPFPVKVLSSKSTVKDNNLQDRKALLINKELLDKEGNNAHERTLDGPDTTKSESNPGLRLFPVFVTIDSDSQLDSHVEQSTKPPSLRSFENPQERDKQEQGDVGPNGATKGDTGGEFGQEDYVEDYDGSPRKKDDDPDPRSNNKIGGGTPPTIPTEKTVKLPNFKTNYLGNWVYNPWGVTYGQMFRDTRFIGLKYSDLTIIYDKHTKLYNPKNVPTKQVCKKESTVYNDIPQKRYLKQAFYHYPQAKSVIYVDLRKEIYEKGKSEECHVPSQTNWRIFNECQMMRHMRMESLVPHYPMIQKYQYMDYNIIYTHQWPLDDDPVWWYDPLAHSPRWPSGTEAWWTHTWHWPWHVKHERK